MKNSQKGFVVPLLIGIIAVLVIGGGVYIYGNKKVEVQPVDVVQTLSTSPTSIPDTTTQIKIDNKKVTESPKITVTPVASTVRVISPNGGETLVIGKSYTVKWWDDSDAGNKTIFAINSVSTKTLISVSGSSFMRSSGIDGTYAYLWNIGSFVTPGSYKLMICKANTNDCDTSDNYFNIVANSSASPTITVLSPNGGEMWQEGKMYPIQWSAKNIPGNQTIKLVNSNNVVIRTIDPNINTVNGGTGLYQYSWSIPQEFVSEASPGKFRILISSSDNAVLDYSDNQFTIYASGRGY